MNVRKWNNRIKTLYNCDYVRADQIDQELQNVQLKCQKHITPVDDIVVLLCVVKNDLLRIKKLVHHYRTLGIRHMVFVDNMSTDGTYEFLMQQDDCDIYRCDQEYSSLRRVVWINQLLSLYTIKRWYIVVDSDELIMYSGMERFSLIELINYAEQIKAYRISGYLVDMYSKGNLFDAGTNEDYVKELNYFDGYGYEIHNTPYGVSITGGPRKRVFKTENELAKCPIFRLCDEDIVASAHFLLPRIKVKYNPLCLAIAHYKFIDDNDVTKIDEAVRKENYAVGSYEYKMYQKGIKNGTAKSFFDENISVELLDSSSLEILPFIKSPFGGV